MTNHHIWKNRLPARRHPRVALPVYSPPIDILCLARAQCLIQDPMRATHGNAFEQLDVPLVMLHGIECRPLA
jgi:hypothetical protein